MSYNFPLKINQGLVACAGKPFRTLLLVVLLFVIVPRINAQNQEKVARTAFINFNVDSNSFDSTARQAVTLFGCNRIISVGGTNGYAWNTPNQVLPGIPFGWQTDTVNGKVKKYYVSKYYIASPPVLGGKTDNPQTLYDIGLVTPDEFVLKGEKPAQLVYLDYSVLEPMYIRYFNVKFDDSFKGRSQDIIPFKVECADFPWTDKKKLVGAKGASGIGSLDKKSTMPQRLFLPYYFKNAADSVAADTAFLDCQVTILNDILLNNQVYFKVSGKHQHGCKKYVSSINLRDYKNENVTITLHCKKRKHRLPCGCDEPGKGKKH